MARHGFLIAATSSGCGKTTLSLGLMRELTRRGLRVQPYKCGPDYIDTQFHKQASGRQSINLDTFMSSASHVGDLFARYSADADVAIVEGVMGMYDGYSKMAGSSAEVSQALSLPVVLLVNAASTAYSVAATIYGFKHFCPGVNIAGVIFNRVSSESHFSFLKDACDDAGVECMGYIKKSDALVAPSRHLGLALTDKDAMEQFINAAADAVAENVAVEKLLDIAVMADCGNIGCAACPEPTKVAAMACDEAFNFVYPANVDRLREQGYEVRLFSPIHDTELPAAHFVYIPGGYPELFAREISANVAMRESIKQYVEHEGRLWAECGGLIYLAASLDGKPMCGILPIECTMEDAKLTLGYRNVDFGHASFRGHEFHYSRVMNPDAMQSVATQTNARGKAVATPVYRHKNAFASYTHIYWGDNDIFKLWE